MEPTAASRRASWTVNVTTAPSGGGRAPGGGLSWRTRRVGPVGSGGTTGSGGARDVLPSFRKQNRDVATTGTKANLEPGAQVDGTPITLSEGGGWNAWRRSTPSWGPAGPGPG